MPPPISPPRAPHRGDRDRTKAQAGGGESSPPVVQLLACSASQVLRLRGVRGEATLVADGHAKGTVVDLGDRTRNALFKQPLDDVVFTMTGKLQALPGTELPRLGTQPLFASSKLPASVSPCMRCRGGRSSGQPS